MITVAVVQLVVKKYSRLILRLCNDTCWV